MAKSKALLIALVGSVVGILGYFLPWITVSMFTERSISGFSLLGMLFGTGSGNVLQELGYSAYFVVPAILLVIALIALVFTGVFSVLLLRTNNVNKTSGILLTIVSGIVFLIVAGIALLVSIAIRRQVGSYVDVGSYIRYGLGFFITSLGAFAVIISGIILFREGLRIESGGTNHFTQGQPAPFHDLGFTQPSQGTPQGQVAAWNQAQFRPNQQPPQQPLSGNQRQPWQNSQNQGWTAPSAPQLPQQLPYSQAPQQMGQSVPNQGWGIPPKPTPPTPLQSQPPAIGQPPHPWQVNQNMGGNQWQVQPPQNTPFTPPKPWSGNPKPGPNSLGQQPPQFRQNNSQPQAPFIQSNQRRPLDKPWEKVQYSGPSQTPQIPQGPPVLPSHNPGQGKVWNQPPKPPYFGKEDPHTIGEYISPLEDPDVTKYDSDLDDEHLTGDNNGFGA